jgi:hypothetical protein
MEGQGNRETKKEQRAKRDEGEREREWGAPFL